MAENASQIIEHPWASGGGGGGGGEFKAPRPPSLADRASRFLPFSVMAPVKFRAGSAPGK